MSELDLAKVGTTLAGCESVFFKSIGNIDESIPKSRFCSRWFYGVFSFFITSTYDWNRINWDHFGPKINSGAQLPSISENGKELMLWKCVYNWLTPFWARNSSWRCLGSPIHLDYYESKIRRDDMEVNIASPFWKGCVNKFNVMKSGLWICTIVWRLPPKAFLPKTDVEAYHYVECHLLKPNAWEVPFKILTQALFVSKSLSASTQTHRLTKNTIHWEHFGSKIWNWGGTEQIKLYFRYLWVTLPTRRQVGFRKFAYLYQVSYYNFTDDLLSMSTVLLWTHCRLQTESIKCTMYSTAW